MSLQTILVAVDFSEQAEVAVGHAAAIARLCDADLVLVHVALPADAGHPGSALSNKTVAEIRSQIEADSQNKLEKVARELNDGGVRATIEVRQGHPDEAIVAAGAELGADLIVTGTHGRTGLARFLLGSVAEKVVRLSQSNVLVTRHRASEDDGYQRILACCDFSPASEKALFLALALAAPNAQVDLFHSWQFPAGTHITGLPDDRNSPLIGLRDEIIAGTKKQAQELIARCPATAATINFVQEHGPASLTIQERLEDHPDYDLVAMGTHGYRGFRHFMLGSVAEATVRHSPCSVLVAHAKGVD